MKMLGSAKQDGKGTAMIPRRSIGENLLQTKDLQRKGSKRCASRIAGTILLCVVLLGQMGAARSRLTVQASHRSRCTMVLNEMKEILERTLGKYAVVSESDKAFVHLQHQHMSCGEYTRKYEQSDFFSDPKARAAIANWHWNTYHSEQTATRSAAIENVEAALVAER